MKFYLHELQNLDSVRTADIVNCKSLRGAKVAAEKRRTFNGTVLIIRDEFGNNLSIKNGSFWSDSHEDCI